MFPIDDLPLPTHLDPIFGRLLIKGGIQIPLLWSARDRSAPLPSPHGGPKLVAGPGNLAVFSSCKSASVLFRPFEGSLPRGRPPRTMPRKQSGSSGFDVTPLSPRPMRTFFSQPLRENSSPAPWPMRVPLSICIAGKVFRTGFSGWCQHRCEGWARQDDSPSSARSGPPSPERGDS